MLAQGRAQCVAMLGLASEQEVAQACSGWFADTLAGAGAHEILQQR